MKRSVTSEDLDEWAKRLPKENVMPNYTAYPKVQDTPSRKQRKAKRKTIFEHNKAQASVERKARRTLRKKELNNDEI